MINLDYNLNLKFYHFEISKFIKNSKINMENDMTKVNCIYFSENMETFTLYWIIYDFISNTKKS